jgi:hypothetical protein
VAEVAAEKVGAKEAKEAKEVEATDQASMPLPRILQGRQVEARARLKQMGADPWVGPTLVTPVVGRPQARWQAWQDRGASDMWVSVLRNGLGSPLDKDFDPASVRWGTPIATSDDQRRWTFQEAMRLQAIGAVVPTTEDELLYCSGTFLVDKSGPKTWRQVINLKPLNPGWASRHEADYHKMEGLAGSSR